MKYLKYLLSAFSLLLLASACNHDPDPIIISSTDPQIEEHAGVVVNANTIKENFTLVWSAAKYGKTTPVSYVVKATTPGHNHTFDATSNCHLTLTNESLFELMGISRMGDYPVTFTVTAQSADGEQKSSRTQVIHFTYTKITYLWIPNGPGFNFTSGRVLQAEDDHFYGFVYLETGEFKFTSQPNWDGTCYGAGAADGMLDGDKTAANIQIEPGHYYMDVDLVTMTFTALKITSVGLHGDVNQQDKPVSMFYDAAAKSWQAISRVAANQEYVVRFNGKEVNTVGTKEYRISLGGDPEALTTGSDQKLVVGSDGIVGFTLSILDFPYHIGEGEVKDDGKKLYVVRKKSAEWDYAGANYLSAILDATGNQTGQYAGLIDLATTSQVLFARMQTEFGIRYGSAFTSLVEYAGGEAATGMNLNAGQYLIYVDLNEGVMKAAPLAISTLALVGDFNNNDATDTSASFTFDANTRRMKLAFSVATKGYMQLVVNQQLTASMNGLTFDTTLGGKAANMQVGGAKFYMPVGDFNYLLDYTKGMMTFATNGQIQDFSPLPNALGVTGDFSGYAWTPAVSPTLWGDGSRGQYWGYLAMYNTAGSSNFKFTYEGNWVAGQLTEDTQYDYLLGQGDNMQIPNGVYRWDVNLNDKTAKATPLTVVGLIGSGVGSWDNDVVMSYDSSDHLFKARVTAVDGEFKVRFNNGWDNNLGGDLNNLTIGGDNIAITAGSYDFVLDLVHTPFKLTVTPVQ